MQTRALFVSGWFFVFVAIGQWMAWSHRCPAAGDKCVFAPTNTIKLLNDFCWFVRSTDVPSRSCVRWLRGHCVYETHLTTNRPPPNIIIYSVIPNGLWPQFYSFLLIGLRWPQHVHVQPFHFILNLSVVDEINWKIPERSVRSCSCITWIVYIRLFIDFWPPFSALPISYSQCIREKSQQKTELNHRNHIAMHGH